MAFAKKNSVSCVCFWKIHLVKKKEKERKEDAQKEGNHFLLKYPQIWQSTKKCLNITRSLNLIRKKPIYSRRGYKVTPNEFFSIMAGFDLHSDIITNRHTEKNELIPREVSFFSL